jgi:hypothetical protein
MVTLTNAKSATKKMLQTIETKISTASENTIGRGLKIRNELRQRKKLTLLGGRLINEGRNATTQLREQLGLGCWNASLACDVEQKNH